MSDFGSADGCPQSYCQDVKRAYCGDWYLSSGGDAHGGRSPNTSVAFRGDRAAATVDIAALFVPANCRFVFAPLAATEVRMGRRLLPRSACGSFVHPSVKLDCNTGLLGGCDNFELRISTFSVDCQQGKARHQMHSSFGEGEHPIGRVQKSVDVFATRPREVGPCGPRTCTCSS